jgi:hypothetical protein
MDHQVPGTTARVDPKEELLVKLPGAKDFVVAKFLHLLAGGLLG